MTDTPLDPVPTPDPYSSRNVTAAVRALPLSAAAIITIYTDGTINTERLSSPPTLADLRQRIGTSMAVPVPRANGKLAFCDEDGLPKRRPHNLAATNYLGVSEMLVGTVCLLIGIRHTTDGFILAPGVKPAKERQ